MKDNDILNNPYLTNQKGFQDRLDVERNNSAFWRNFCMVSMALNIFSVGGMIYAAQLPDVVPFLFKEDGTGGITALGLARQKLHVNQKMIQNQLANFITDLRQVPQSLEIRKQYVSTVKVMSSSSLWNNLLLPMMKNNYLKAAQNDVIVEIKNILPIQGNTWEIDFIEYTKIDQSDAIKYKAMMTITRSQDFKTADALVFNPLGIVVTDLTINPQLGN